MASMLRQNIQRHCAQDAQYCNKDDARKWREMIKFVERKWKSWCEIVSLSRVFGRRRHWRERWTEWQVPSPGPLTELHLEVGSGNLSIHLQHPHTGVECSRLDYPRPFYLSLFLLSKENL